MSEISRRSFLAQSSLALGVVAASGRLTAAANPRPRLTSGADQVVLGRTGVKTSLVGMGTGSVGVKRSSNQVRLGQDKFNRLVRHAFDRGITYFDTADQYGSHIFLREALKGIPRDKLFIQTKTRAISAEVAKADLDRFREELGVDYVDSLLMHCMTKSSWPTDFRPVMDVLSDAKAKGWVRASACRATAWTRSAPRPSAIGWRSIWHASIRSACRPGWTARRTKSCRVCARCMSTARACSA